MESYLRFLAALVLVIGLIGAIAWVARRLGLAGRLAAVGGRGARRLGVIEYMALDSKTRLVLVRRDDTQHLLLLSAGGPVVVERGIDATAQSASASDANADISKLEAAV